MEAQAEIRHRLDLAMRLVDSVSGRAIEERDVRFYSRSFEAMPLRKGGGIFLFLNTGREAHEIEVNVYGYEPRKFMLDYPEPEERLPIREVYLLPLDNPARDDVLTLRGRLPGIKAIEAVSLKEAECYIKAFDARKRSMVVLNQRSSRFHHIHYGLISREGTAYEHFEVEEELSLYEIKCRKALEREFQANQPVARVIFGQVTGQGEYVLKVPNGANALYLVRFEAEGKEYYQKVDFHAEGNLLECREPAEEKEG